MATTPVSTATATRQRGASWLERLRIQARRPGDFLFRGGIYLFVAIVLFIVAGIAWVLVSESWLSITTNGWSFLTNDAFDPNNNTYGVRPAIFGTLVTSGIRASSCDSDWRRNRDLSRGFQPTAASRARWRFWLMPSPRSPAS